MPELTVLMAVYNAEDYLRDAIDSILAQTFTNFEFLIINDGSTDTSKSIIESYTDPRICLLDNPENLGLTTTLNRGLSHITTPFIARQDADDVSAPLRLEKQVLFLQKYPQIALVGSQGYDMNIQGKQTGFMHRALEDQSIRWEFLFYNSFIHTAVTCRTEIISQLGGYNEHIRYCQDYELWSRLMRHHKVANLPDPLISRRIHDASMTQTMQPLRLSESLQAGQYHLQTLFKNDIQKNAYERLLHFLQTPNQIPFASSYQTFEHILKQYQERHLQHIPPDFYPTVLRQYIRMISQLQNKNQIQGFQMVVKTLQKMPQSIFSLPWHRIFAKAFFA